MSESLILLGHCLTGARGPLEHAYDVIGTVTADNESSLLECCHDLQLVVVDMFSESLQAGENHRHLAGRQRAQDHADTGMGDDAFRFSDQGEHFVVGHEFAPCRSQ